MGGELFVRNRGGSSKLLAWVMYFACRLLLPRLLRVNAVTAARGKQCLLEQWDHLDNLLQQQEEQQQKGTTPGSGGDRLPYYLTGPDLTAAGVCVCVCVGVPFHRSGGGWPDLADTLCVSTLSAATPRTCLQPLSRRRAGVPGGTSGVRAGGAAGDMDAASGGHAGRAACLL
jgi:hypothetical protein